MSINKLLIFTLFSLGTLLTFAQEQPQEGHDDGHSSGQHAEHEYNASETILHHILDSHDWHITDLPGGTSIALHLPYMVISDGFHFVGSPEGLLEKGLAPFDETVVKLKGDPAAAKAMLFDDHGHLKHMSQDDKDAFAASYIDEEASVIDMSITKTSLQMILVGLLLLFIFRGVAKSYEKNRGKAPSGLQSFMEPIIVFVRDDIARPWLHGKADAFLPYLLTLFFFIWIANLIGLTPFNSNIMGNISVTAALAVLTFILIQVNASKDYWIHVINTPGVPWWLKFGIPIMPIVEILGLFTKPFALAIRLFANISAGHFMVLGLVSLIFILGEAGGNPAGGFGVAPLSLVFTLVIFCLEMIVAIIQPYIFTLLTAVFIGMAMESHDDHH